MDISEKARNDINGILRYEGDNIKGFVFVKENGKIIKIRNIHFVDGLQILPQFQNTLALYKWTSMHAHASYLSVLQFGQAYSSKKVDSKRIRDAALYTFVYHYTFAAKSKSLII